MLKRLFFSFFTLLSATSCGSLFYYPSRGVHFPPELNHVDPLPEDVWLQTEDHFKVHAWYLKADAVKPPQGVIVFFHGNAENLTSHYANLLWITKERYDFLIFDYRGYGMSEGKSTDARGTVLDGKAAVIWAASKYPKIPLIVYGQSLGGAVALRTLIELKKANQLPAHLRLIVADSTFYSYQAIGNRVLTRSWLTWPFQWLPYLLISDRYAPDDQIKNLSPIPLLVIHGDQDQTVDFELGQKLFEQAAEPKEFWKVEGGQHTDVFWREQGKYRVQFLDRLSKLSI